MVAMECTPDRDLLLIQIPVAKMKRSISFVQIFARVRILFSHLDVRQSHLSHKRMIRLCRDHGDELNDTKKSVIRCHNHSAII